MNRQETIAKILQRAKSISSIGYVTLSELQGLSIPNGSIYNDSRYEYGTELVIPDLPICASSRSVYWIGGIEERHLDYSGQFIKDTRHCVAHLVEIGVQGEVQYSIPFPAHGIVGSDHDRAMWKFSQEMLEECNDIQLDLIRTAIRA